MFSNVYNFAKRHRRKFVYAGAAASAVVVVGKVVEVKYKNWQEEEMKNLMEQTRKRHHFETTERTGNLTLQSLFPELKGAILECFKSEEIVEKIRNHPEEKIKLWNELKIVSFSRCLSYVYGGIFLTLLMRVQLNILGGFLYQETIEKQTEESMRLSQRVQERFLLFNQIFITKGLKDLCEYIKEKVKVTLSNVGLKSKLSLLDLEQLFREVVQSISNDRREEESPKFNPCKYLIFKGDDFNDLDESEKETMKNLVNSLEDILENVDMHKIFSDCTIIGFAASINSISTLLKSNINEPFSMNHKFPLAKLLPLLSNSIQINNEDLNMPNDLFCNGLIKSEIINKCAANVYEAFCDGQQDVKSNQNGETESFGFQRFIQLFV